MKTWWRIALLNFLIAGTIGALLRFAFVEELGWMNFRYWLHAHSHVAMLGWVYLALFTFLVPAFAGKRSPKTYKSLFWGSQFTVAGMLLSFPVQGYGPVSITFSTLHVLLSYVFIYRLWKDMRLTSTGFSWSTLFTRTALLFLLLSSLGLWGMAVVMATGMRGTAWYYLTVQFYLHWQFYGWFLFGIFALLFKSAENNGAQFDATSMRGFYGLLLGATFLTFALPVTWAYPAGLVFGLNSIGVVLLIIATVLLLRILRSPGSSLHSFTDAHPARLFFRIALAAFVFSTLLRGLTAVPQVTVISYTVRNFMIGFIHLILLGVVSMFLLGYAARPAGVLPQNKWMKAGTLLFATGFTLSELLLFGQGAMLWGAMGFLPGYYSTLFALSACMPAGLACLFLASLKAPT